MANSNLNNDDSNINTAKLRTKPDPELTVGKRLKNPLGALSSYNYQISLYMMTPEALDVFVANGGRNLDGIVTSTKGYDSSAGVIDRPGAFLIAQSGGINNENELRAPSFKFDYYIDDLMFESVLPKGNGSSSVQHTFKFTVVEPYGFSFITNLRRAADAMQQYDKKAQSTPENPTRHFFLLGVRFYGYDDNGLPVNGTTKIPITNLDGKVINEQGEELDPGNPTERLFERYFPIVITSMANTVEGKEVKYNIEAQSYNLEALGAKRGIILNPITITGSTVKEALDMLFSKLTKEQEKLGEGVAKFKYAYNIAPEDSAKLGSASLISEADTDKYKWPGSGAKNTTNVNPSTETNQSNKPRNNTRTITIESGTSIIQAIDQIISQSSFLRDALKVVYTTALEPDTDKKDIPTVNSDAKKKIEWYNCTPDINNINWNNKTADWNYEIVYRLNIYETPVVDSAYTNPGINFYGPVKKYDYWYTGQNTEILKYKQTLNNNFYLTYLSDTFVNPAASTGSPNIAGSLAPLVQGQRSNLPDQGKAGLGSETANSYLTSLFDPVSQATAEIEILGDPDLLCSTVPRRNTGEQVVYNKFYGIDGYSVDPTSGQVVVNINFKEAIDYNLYEEGFTVGEGQITAGSGLMAINSSILFWRDPKKINKNLSGGIYFQVYQVASTLSNGRFTQKLSCVIVMDQEALQPGAPTTGIETAGREKPSITPPASGPTNTNSKATTKNTGFKKPPASLADQPTIRPTRAGSESLLSTAQQLQRLGGNAPGTTVGIDSARAKAAKIGRGLENIANSLRGNRET